MYLCIEQRSLPGKRINWRILRNTVQTDDMLKPGEIVTRTSKKALKCSFFLQHFCRFSVTQIGSLLLEMLCFVFEYSLIKTYTNHGNNSKNDVSRLQCYHFQLSPRTSSSMEVKLIDIMEHLQPFGSFKAHEGVCSLLARSATSVLVRVIAARYDFIIIIVFIYIALFMNSKTPN